MRIKIGALITAFFLMAAFMMGCVGMNDAPVIKPIVPVSRPGYYYVRPGDTLYSIAWVVGVDYHKLAEINGIKTDQQIQANQYLLINPKYAVPTDIKATPIRKVKTIRTKTSIKIQSAKLPQIHRWIWPATGTVIGTYSPSQGNKGINIAGKEGTPIRAAASGIVVYDGAGLPAYGKMIIIKNSDVYLSAYAHNEVLLVKEGEEVHQGQIIARMGNTGSNRTMLHFEIRKNGQPINPLLYLKK